MITRDTARSNKEIAREKLTSLGFTVISVGITKESNDWAIKAGVLQEPRKDQRYFKVNDVPVSVVWQPALVHHGMK